MMKFSNQYAKVELMKKTKNWSQIIVPFFIGLLRGGVQGEGVP